MRSNVVAAPSAVIAIPVAPVVNPLYFAPWTIVCELIVIRVNIWTSNKCRWYWSAPPVPVSCSIALTLAIPIWLPLLVVEELPCAVS